MVKKKKLSKKLDKHFQNKKKLAITLVAAFVVAAVIIGSGYIYNEISTTNTKNQTLAESDKPAADHIKSLAFDAFTDKKYTQAKALYQTAEKQYQYIVDNSTDQPTVDTAQNQVQDCRQMLFQIGMQTNK